MNRAVVIALLVLILAGCKTTERVIERRIPVPAPGETIVVPDTTGYGALEDLLEEAFLLGWRIDSLDSTASADDVHRAFAQDVNDYHVFVKLFIAYAQEKLAPFWFGGWDESATSTIE